MKKTNWVELKETIKRKLIIERLQLEDMSSSEIEDDMPLFEEGLGLDSIEAFEIIVGMGQIFDVKVDQVPAEEMKAHLYSVTTIARFVQDQLEKKNTGE